MKNPHRFYRPTVAHSKVRLAAAISAILTAAAQLPTPAVAADDIGEIIVTATRRSESISDIPYNISAVGSADIGEQRGVGLHGTDHASPSSFRTMATPWTMLTSFCRAAHRAV